MGWLEPDDGWALGVLEMGRVDETKLPASTVEQHRVGTYAMSDEQDAVEWPALEHARCDEAQLLAVRRIHDDVDCISGSVMHALCA